MTTKHTRTRRRGVRWIVLLLVGVLVLASCGDGDDGGTEAGGEDTTEAEVAGEQEFQADAELLERALGTSEEGEIPPLVLEAVARAGEEVDGERLDLAIRCWRDNVCDTGTGGDITVALADGFGENVWREITHMEFVLQALTYPEIGRIIYTSAQGDTQKAISDFRSLIAQDVDVITTFADAGEALLPTARQATQQGITVVPYIASVGGEEGEGYLSFVAEDLCELGRNFAEVVNTQLDGSGKVAFLGGTPGNPLSQAWQTCEREALADGIEIVGTADTNWTREGTLEAMSGFLSQHPDLDAVSYEYSDGFLGGVRAFQAAGQPLDIVLTLRTDEMGLFCQWREIGNPEFEIFYSSGGSFQSRIALTVGMTAEQGEDVPARLVVPASMRQVDDSACLEGLPGEAPTSTLVPENVLTAMYGQ